MVGGVRVDLQQHVVAEAFADRAHRLDVPAGLDLQLDAQIAGVQIGLHRRQQLGDAVHDADRDPGRHRRAHRAQVLSE